MSKIGNHVVGAEENGTLTFNEQENCYKEVENKKKVTSPWKYVRTNSKGEKIFRRDTNETLEDVEKYLDSKNIGYESKPSGSMMYIEIIEGGDNGSDRHFAYYPTTGRWSVYPFRKKHYRSNGIEDFLTRFAYNMKGTEPKHARPYDHVWCYSYPNCDVDKNGCREVMGDDAEPYGWRD
jgi:hypothetical protein